MNNFQEFYRGLIKYGLEFFNLFYGSYPAVVIDSNDPEKRGRIRIKANVIGNRESEWIYPGGSMPYLNGGGFVFLPEKGDRVFVRFLNGRLELPFWEYSHFSKSNKSISEGPDKVKIQTRAGQKIEIDKKSDVITVTNSAGVKIEIAETISITDGNLELGEVLGRLLTALEALTVPTLVGPSGGPINLPEFTKVKTDLKTLLKE